ncbi:sugar phosphate nucleotidyltransferase [Bdellovibrio sp. GT3]|uniref:sugar phosphate nucleotidyltransferase n=1 Tax=Bdellovibrio sp. GT3 TaxID=3136282 RepID=UPI0030F181F7
MISVPCSLVKKGRSVPPPIKPIRYGILVLNIIQGNATLGTSELETKTLVLLAGGKASRLNDFLNAQGQIKCLSRFGNFIFLDYLLKQAQQSGIQHVILLAGPDRDSLMEYVSGKSYSMRFSFPEEPIRLGTGGALALIGPYLKESSFILSNADTFFEECPFPALSKHPISGKSIFLMGRSDGIKMLELVSKGEVQKWSDLYNTEEYKYVGVALLNSDIIYEWEKLGLPAECSFEKDVFGKIRDESDFLLGSFAEIDFGTREGYLQLKAHLEGELV